MAIRSSEVFEPISQRFIIITKYRGKALTVLNETSGYEDVWRSGLTSLITDLGAGRN
jgi:hypothetical protein